VARLSLLAAGVVALGGAAALGVIALGKQPVARGPKPDEVARVAAAIDGTLRERAAALSARVGTLAELPLLRSAVSTDAATVQDLTSDELAFRVKEAQGETIEIAQVLKGSGKVTSLLRLPPSSPAVVDDMGKAGRSLHATARGLVLSEAVDITPQDTSLVEKGVIAVSWAVDLAPVAPQLASLGTPAFVGVGDRRVAGDLTTSGPTINTPLADGKAFLAVVTMPPVAPDRTPLFAGAGGLGLLGLVLAGLGFVGGKRRVQEMPPAIIPSANPTPSVLMGPGAQFGRYSLVKRLGSGGMAEVYLARLDGEAGFEKQLALKIMHRDLASFRPEAVELFLDEARLASKLSHPNIVPITDLGKTGESFYIAMEYVEGCDLDVLRERCLDLGTPIPAGIALAILRKVCDGLHHAHTATVDGRPLGIVHRDVKSQNVLISRAGAVKITDFGIAKAEEKVSRTEIGQVKGTIQYMSPEQRTGQPVDARADVYGVGAIAYEILSGSAIDLDLVTLAVKGREGWPHLAPLSHVRPDLPPELDDVIFKALSFDREDRFTTCGDFSDALEGVVTRHGLHVSDKLLAQWVEGQFTAYAAAARG
jgi:hypothetical protein